jgi:hypothetical protein
LSPSDRVDKVLLRPAGAVKVRQRAFNQRGGSCRGIPHWKQEIQEKRGCFVGYEYLALIIRHRELPTLRRVVRPQLDIGNVEDADYASSALWKRQTRELCFARALRVQLCSEGNASDD